MISTLHPGSPENLFDFYLLVSRRLGGRLCAPGPGSRGNRPRWPGPCGRRS
ncbi:MAG: hypothetical protein ACLUNZ_06685 [Evtepia sp.]